MKTNSFRAGVTRAFTLIEIMVVLLVISIIIAFTIPAIGPALNGSKLKQASDAIEGVLSVAKQVSLTENETVQMRFYKYDDEEAPGDAEQYRAVQAVIERRDPEDHQDVLEIVPVTKVVPLPMPYIISPSAQFSTLVQEQGRQSGIADTPRADNADWVGFEFRPDGTTNLTTVPEEHFTITIMAEKQELESELPKEYITLLLDPFNGQVRRFQ